MVLRRRGGLYGAEKEARACLRGTVRHTHRDPVGEGVDKKKAEEAEEEEKNCLQVIKISQVIALYFPPTDPGGPRDRLCDVAADRKQMRHNEQQHPRIFFFLCYHSD